MGCSGKMDPVPLQEIPRYHWVVNNDADLTPQQLINDGRDISGALVLRPAETEIIGARLQDDDIGVVGDSAIDAAEHAGSSITDDAGCVYRKPHPAIRAHSITAPLCPIHDGQ